jgi:hypothetical protein
MFNKVFFYGILYLMLKKVFLNIRCFNMIEFHLFLSPFHLNPANKPCFAFLFLLTKEVYLPLF